MRCQDGKTFKKATTEYESLDFCAHSARFLHPSGTGLCIAVVIRVGEAESAGAGAVTVEGSSDA
jgi:hypothetical protein